MSQDTQPSNTLGTSQNTLAISFYSLKTSLNTLAMYSNQNTLETNELK